MSSLAEEYPKQQARCRELLCQYKEIGPAGTFGETMIEQILRRADGAAASGDVVAMDVAYTEMRECQ
jgi:hypothetical protein